QFQRVAVTLQPGDGIIGVADIALGVSDEGGISAVGTFVDFQIDPERVIARLDDAAEAVRAVRLESNRYRKEEAVDRRKGRRPIPADTGFVCITEERAELRSRVEAQFAAVRFNDEMTPMEVCTPALRRAAQQQRPARVGVEALFGTPQPREIV